VVKLLLETGKVDVDSKDTTGRTPLSWAAGRGHEAVVKLLLETGMVDVDSKDTTGQTPLSWAAGGGHETVVKLLQLLGGQSRANQ
jgi:ankyrin repeat protein